VRDVTTGIVLASHEDIKVMGVRLQHMETVVIHLRELFSFHDNDHCTEHPDLDPSTQGPYIG
jgi:hypothetical protein